MPPQMRKILPARPTGRIVRICVCLALRTACLLHAGACVMRLSIALVVRFTTITLELSHPPN
jgi:hypothetical protein